MIELKKGAVYEIELCCGDLVRWRYLGLDARGAVWWHDLSSGKEFNEASLMYAWQLRDQCTPPAGE
jgi:hypothetical protein